jgi:hypothetical protein
MPKAKKPMMPAFAGFGMDPSSKKMSARYTISMTINPADFGLTGSEDNNTMAAAVVKVLEAQGAAAERKLIVARMRRAGFPDVREEAEWIAKGAHLHVGGDPVRLPV